MESGDVRVKRADYWVRMLGRWWRVRGRYNVGIPGVLVVAGVRRREIQDWMYYVMQYARERERITELEKELAMWRSEVDRLDRLADTDRETVTRLNRQLGEVTTDRDRWRTAGERYSQEREDARAEVKAKESRIADILRRLDDARAEADRLRAELAEVTARADDLQVDLVDSRAEADHMRERITELEHELAKVTTERDRWQGEAERTQQRFEQQCEIGDENALHRLRLHRELREARAELKDDVAARDETIHRLQQRVDDLTTELATARRDDAAVVERIARDQCDDCRDDALAAAAEIRDGTRPVPGSPQPEPKGK